jgi:hypothetical protein
MIAVLFVVLMFLVSLLCLYAVPQDKKWETDKNGNILTIKTVGVLQVLSIINTIVGLFLIITTLSTSYCSYLEMRSFYSATVEQYREQITLYKDNSDILSINAFTDFRGQGYQKEMSSKISELRLEIVKYNKNYVVKRVLKRNIIFSWLIVDVDEDMKILRLNEKGE